MDQYDVEDWIRNMAVPRRKRRAIARELRGHLEDSQRELTLAGWDPEAAKNESARRLGDPDEITRNFDDVYRRPRHLKVGLAVALATGLLVGAYGGGAAAFNGSTHTHAVRAQQVHEAVPLHRASVKR